MICERADFAEVTSSKRAHRNGRSCSREFELNFSFLPEEALSFGSQESRQKILQL